MSDRPADEEANLADSPAMVPAYAEDQAAEAQHDRWPQFSLRWLLLVTLLLALPLGCYRLGPLPFLIGSTVSGALVACITVQPNRRLVAAGISGTVAGMLADVLLFAGLTGTLPWWIAPEPDAPLVLAIRCVGVTVANFAVAVAAGVAVTTLEVRLAQLLAAGDESPSESAESPI